METVTCYICNNMTTDFCTNMFELKSQHSNTRICEYLKKFLGNFESLRNADSELNCACSDCLNRIDEYDWACVMSARFEQELIETLLNAERAQSNKAAETKKNDVDCKQKSANEYCVQLSDTEETFRSLESDKKLDSDVETNNDRSIDDGNDDPDFWGDSIGAEDDSEDVECSTKHNTETKAQESESMPKKQRKQDLTMEKRYQLLAKQSEYQFNCTKCGETFSLKTQLHDHERLHIKQQAEFRCKICSYISKNAAYCEEHAELHKNRPELECVFCNKEFESTLHLKRHMIYHADDSFLCYVCGKAFNNTKSFNGHMKYHLNIRSYKCSLCPLKTFVLSSHLDRHMQKHNKDKPFTCSICGNAFRYRHNMRTHEKTHSETDKIHECSFCDAKFARKSKLNQHLEKQHSTQTSTSINSLFNGF